MALSKATNLFLVLALFVSTISLTVQSATIQTNRIRRQGYFADSFTSGSLLNNLFKRDAPLQPREEAVRANNGRVRRQGFYADPLTSGTLLSNLFKRAVDDEALEQKRAKRQGFFADGFTSGTLLNNLFRRRRRAMLYDAEIPFFT